MAFILLPKSRIELNDGSLTSGVIHTCRVYKAPTTHLVAAKVTVAARA